MIQQNKTYGKILALSQDADVMMRLQGYMTDVGFAFNQYETPAAILKAYEQQGADLLMVDLDDNTQQGFDLLAHFGHRYPDMPIICLVLSAREEALNSLRMGAWDCIEKSKEQLPQIEQAVCKALERGRIIHENKLYRYELEKTNQQLQSSLRELEHDHKAGKSVQEQIFPKPHVQFGEYSFSYKILPSLYLSGDMVDYFQIDKQHVCFYLADVSGHGASSAFVTIMLKVLFDQMVQDFINLKNETILKPKVVLQLANQYVKAANLGKYITMVFCVLNTDNHQLTYSVAGHYPNPIMIDGHSARFVSGKGFAVGMIKEVEFDEHTLEFPKDGLLALFSDGLMEEISGETLDDKERTLLACMHPNLSVEEMLTYLKLNTLRDHADDVTLLFVGRQK